MTPILGALSIYLFFSVAVSIYFISYALTRGKTPVTSAFSLLYGCIAIYLFGYLLELNSTNIDSMVFWNLVQYFGLSFFPSFWLLLCLVYSGSLKRIGPAAVPAIFVIPVATFFIRLTNRIHHLYYTGYSINNVGGLSILHIQKGPWYIVHASYLTLCALTTTVIYLVRSSRSCHSDRAGYRLTVFASIIPYAGLVMVVLDFWHVGLDFTALVLPISLLLMFLSFLRYDILSIKALARSEIFERNSIAMVVLDCKNGLIDRNSSSLKLFDGLGDLGYGDCIFEVLPHELCANDFSVFGSPKDVVFEIEGEKLYYEAIISEIIGFESQTVGKLISLSDITARKKAEEALRESEEKMRLLANTDGLTGLSSRSRFMNLGELELSRSRRDNQLFSLLMMDIDHFKSVNDTYGHGGGDEVLRAAGMLIKRHFRLTDFSGRIGGEEFGVILPNTGIEGAYRTAEEFRMKIADENILYDGNSISITFSIGVCTSGPEIDSFEQILRLADRALYSSKENGRNRVTTYLDC